MKIEYPVNERTLLRSRWHVIRNARLALKNNMITENVPISKIRHNREYKGLKKEQKLLSRMISHIERKINKTGKNEE